VQEKNNKNTGKRQYDPELILSAFLLIFIALAIIFTTVLVIVFATGTPDGNGDSTHGSHPGEDDNSSEYVFAGATLSSLPYMSGSSSEVSSINSEYAALIDAESGEILAYKNADKKFNPASLTKVMSLIVMCESLTQEDLDREVLMSEDMLTYVTSGNYVGMTRSYFEIGHSVKVKDLLYGIGIVSAADCAMMVVRYLFPEDNLKRAEARFADLMNEKVTQMGLKDTHFDNAIGHESEENYTTASDMAAIMAYALECPMIEDILSYSKAYSFRVNCTKDGVEESLKLTHYSTLFNVNPQRSSRIRAYENKFGEFSLSGAEFLGGKTGTLGEGTKSEPYLYSLASFAESDGKTYILITGETTLSYGMMVDAKTLYEDYIK